jgi:pimeloyl-ACP methyl ester carboxylesterase
MTELPEPYYDTVVTARDGRRLGVARWGCAGGTPVVSHHGTPMCRLDVPASPGLLESLGIDLIMIDRAGYGRSTAMPGRTVAAAAADIAGTADALGVERFAVHGVSGGGPHALACAALLDGRVTRTASVVGVAPWDSGTSTYYDGMCESNVAEFETARQGRAALERYVAEFMIARGRDPGGLFDEWMDELPEPDRQAYQAPDMRAWLDRALDEALAGSTAGWVDDDLAFVTDWGFALSDIRSPVSVWHGALDVLAPPIHARMIAAEIPNSELHIVPDRGHELDHGPIFRWLCQEAT